MTPEEFLSERISETERKFLTPPITKTDEEALNLCKAVRTLLDWHKKWPTLVTEEPELKGEPSIESITYYITQRHEWMMAEEYRKRFGTSPPTSPILRGWLETYRDHPDFDPAWLGE